MKVFRSSPCVVNVKQWNQLLGSVLFRPRCMYSKLNTQPLVFCARFDYDHAWEHTHKSWAWKPEACWKKVGQKALSTLVLAACCATKQTSSEAGQLRTFSASIPILQFNDKHISFGDETPESLQKTSLSSLRDKTKESHLLHNLETCITWHTAKALHTGSHYKLKFLKECNDSRVR